MKTGNLGQAAYGIIPACAGGPDVRSTSAQNASDYPRVRGRTSTSEFQRESDDGLSPRAREDQHALNPNGEENGLSPRAREDPVRVLLDRGRYGDYPRVRGRTCFPAGFAVRCVPGLSPRAREDPSGFSACVAGCGIIPASVGGPASTGVRRSFVSDYARVRGVLPRRSCGSCPPVQVCTVRKFSGPTRGAVRTI